MTLKSKYASRSEYWADGIVHITGVLLSLAASIGLAIYALTQPSNILTIPLLAYCFGLFATFAFSAAYNMTLKPDRRVILQKFDRAAIFIMIAGTYTPLGLLGIAGQWGIYLVIANWVIAIAGAITTLLFYKKIERLSLVLYLVQSWLVIIAIKPMYDELSTFAFSMIILGGLTYSAGVIFYRREDWKFNHAIWHAFVLSAAAIHFLAILNVAEIV